MYKCNMQNLVYYTDTYCIDLSHTDVLQLDMMHVL